MSVAEQVLSVVGVESDSVRLKLQKVCVELNAKYLERADVIDGMLVSVLIGQHCLLLGDPGTGKSALSTDLLGFCFKPDDEDAYFECLMSDSLPPDELFGQYKLSSLRADRYERQVSGRLPSCRFAMLDEIFKCSTVLKTLFKLLNERVFYNDGRIVNTRLNTVVGASNELPEDGEGLEALWDRFLLRYWVFPLSPANRSVLRRQRAAGERPGLTTQITLEELTLLQKGVQSIRYSSDADDLLMKLEESLTIASGKESALKRPSDRRSCQFVDLLKGYAYLCGDNEVTEEHFSILQFALWEESPDEMHRIKKLISKLSHSIIEDLRRLLLSAQEALDEAKEKQQKESQAAWLQSAGRAAWTIEQVVRESDKIIAQALKNGLGSDLLKKAESFSASIKNVHQSLGKIIAENYVAK
jgi:MoxR-like ATPase